jgi:hypothetical protein
MKRIFARSAYLHSPGEKNVLFQGVTIPAIPLCRQVKKKGHSPDPFLVFLIQIQTPTERFREAILSTLETGNIQLLRIHQHYVILLLKPGGIFDILTKFQKSAGKKEKHYENCRQWQRGSWENHVCRLFDQGSGGFR